MPIFCNQCGTANHESAQFCIQCGTPLIGAGIRAARHPMACKSFKPTAARLADLAPKSAHSLHCLLAPSQASRAPSALG